VSDLSGPEITFFAILVAAFVLLITERLRNDVVGVLIVLALAMTGLLEPREALAGFSSEPAIVVAAIFVLTAGMHSTGLSDQLGRLGHHGNLLVYGPGGYRFADFVVVGTPLTIVAALVVALLAPLVFGG